MQATKRLRVLQGLIILIFLGVIFRLGVLQIAKDDLYKAQAAAGVPASANIKRGDIYFSGKEGPMLAATEAVFYTVAIDSRKIKDPEGVFAFLSREFGMTRADFTAKTRDTTDPFEEVARRIPEDRYRALDPVSPDGVVYVPSTDRFYPAGTLAAHVLGFLGDSAEGRVGRYGVEESFNDVLAEESTPESLSLFESFRGGLVFNGESAVVLTIDPALQTYVEEVLDHTLSKYLATRGGVILMDPKTGKILSMAARPAFDPNTYADVEGARTYINPNLSNQYEMGSVVKPLTFLAAFNARAARPTDTYFDAGFRTIDGYTVNNHDKKARGTIPLQEVLNQSLNTGVIHLMERMGMDTFSNFMKSLKLGEKADIGLPETAGNIKNLSSRSELDRATASFGQGIGVTPIGLIRALATIANDGVEPRPYIVAEVRHANGKTEKHEPSAGDRVASSEAAAQISKMLVTVVDDALLQGEGKITGYSVGAKTGTAQIPNPNSKGYLDAYLHSFFGYAPATNPKFIMLLYIERPVGVAFSSQSLTPPFKDIMTYALQYYQIPPDRQIK